MKVNESVFQLGQTVNERTITMTLPIGEPSTVPAGIYYAKVLAEATEMTSKYDANRKYFTLPLEIVNNDRERFDYVWAFGPKNVVYLKFLEIIGGTQMASGKVVPPISEVGKTFVVKINEQPSKDKSRLVNSIIAVYPDNRQAAKEGTPAPDAEIDPSIPF